MRLFQTQSSLVSSQLGCLKKLLKCKKSVFWSMKNTKYKLELEDNIFLNNKKHSKQEGTKIEVK